MEFWASGKLLLFGEYLVLRGTKSLSIPLTMGQSLTVQPSEKPGFSWTSKAANQQWFFVHYTDELTIVETNDEEVALTLSSLLLFIQTRHPELFSKPLSFETNINFKREWGLGTSSTLISLLSQWSQMDAYQLLANSFEGSGYDVACATATSPILYEVIQHKVSPVLIHRPIVSRLLFVYLGNKQNSYSAIQKFSETNVPKSCLSEMNQIIDDVLETQRIEHFEQLMYQSEALVGSILGQTPIKEKYFSDYPYAIKSLGAWGGDFFMATFREEEEARYYFLEKGYKVQFNYFEIIRNK